MDSKLTEEKGIQKYFQLNPSLKESNHCGKTPLSESVADRRASHKILSLFGSASGRRKAQESFLPVAPPLTEFKKKVRGKHSIPRPVSHELPLALETHIHTFARPSARGWRLPDEGLNETTVRHVLVSPASSSTTTTITKPIHLPETGITGESYDAMGAHAHQRTQ